MRSVFPKYMPSVSQILSFLKETHAVPALLVENLPESALINSKLSASLSSRLAQSREYSEEEVERVETLESRLFPANFEISKLDGEQLRALCMLSQSELKDAGEICSHRPLLGKLIVPAKRFVWKILSAQLKDSFSAIQEFQMWAVVNQAKLLVRIYELEESSQTAVQKDHKRSGG